MRTLSGTSDLKIMNKHVCNLNENFCATGVHPHVFAVF